MSLWDHLPAEQVAALARPATPGRWRVKHLGEPGSDVALCGARRGRSASPSDADLCVVCGDMARSFRFGGR